MTQDDSLYWHTLLMPGITLTICSTERTLHLQYIYIYIYIDTYVQYMNKYLRRVCTVQYK